LGGLLRDGGFRLFRRLPCFFGLFPSAGPGKAHRKMIKNAGAFQGFPYPVPVDQEKTGYNDKKERPE
jgi:hypothetical protein